MNRAQRIITEGKILLHMSGTPGSGKTTLLNQLAQKHPNIAFKDVDDFNRDYGTSTTKRVDTRIKNWAKKEKRPIVFGGIDLNLHGKPMFHLPEPERKYRLNTGSIKSAWRSNKRWRAKSKEYGGKSPKISDQVRSGIEDWRQACKDKGLIAQRGYTPKSSKSIRREVGALANEYKPKE